MCDRLLNPTLQDVSRLYSKWRLTDYGSDRNGKELAESLTSSPCGGLPLGDAITSDENERTIKNFLQLLLKVLPEGSFYGSKNGPKVVITDYSNTKRAAISQTWPNAHLLLCVFHFLQSNWTWLHEGKNKI